MTQPSGSRMLNRPCRAIRPSMPILLNSGNRVPAAPRCSEHRDADVVLGKPLSEFDMATTWREYASSESGPTPWVLALTIKSEEERFMPTLSSRGAQATRHLAIRDIEIPRLQLGMTHRSRRWPRREGLAYYFRIRRYTRLVNLGARAARRPPSSSAIHGCIELALACISGKATG
jgi:hypothetical protein